MRRSASLAVLALPLWFAPIELCGQATTITVSGIRGNPIQLNSVDLAQMPQQTVKATAHGTEATFEGVLLTDVLAKVEQPSGAKFRSTAAAYYLLVEAADGYRAVFAWAELDATISDRKIYLVMKRDGKPLPAEDGPFQLVVPADKQNARWVRQVTALRIKAS